MAAPHPPVIIVPGWRDSGPGHWQSLWADRQPKVERVRPGDWPPPTRVAWFDALAKTIEAAPGPAVLAAHSLGCMAVMHLPTRVLDRTQGAWLVAPAAPERRAVLSDFAPAPCERLPHRSILVARQQRSLLFVPPGGRPGALLGQRICSLAGRRPHQRRVQAWRMAAGPDLVVVLGR